MACSSIQPSPARPLSSSNPIENFRSTLGIRGEGRDRHNDAPCGPRMQFRTGLRLLILHIRAALDFLQDLLWCTKVLYVPHQGQSACVVTVRLAVSHSPEWSGDDQTIWAPPPRGVKLVSMVRALIWLLQSAEGTKLLFIFKCYTKGALELLILNMRMQEVRSTCLNLGSSPLERAVLDREPCSCGKCKSRPRDVWLQAIGWRCQRGARGVGIMLVAMYGVHYSGL